MTDRMHPDDIKLLADAIRASRDPQDHEVSISDSKPWTINYYNRKHIFIWLPSTSLTMNFEDYGSGTVQAQVWTNLAIPQGVRVTTTGQTSAVKIIVRATDEVIP